MSENNKNHGGKDGSKKSGCINLSGANAGYK